ncbi:MAG: hypothetical protein SFT94_07705 [Pseudanabaenaceae cyanobacterium bins.68]|nr:hypothetical protein [Pseudanabaenaceae cyanobacterium bins.68]
MYIIELVIKGNPLTLAVQRKDQEGAEHLYQDLVQRLSRENHLIELSCEKEIGKKVAVFSGEVSAIAISEKSGNMTNLGAGFVR